MYDLDILYLPVRELGARIRAKQLSPVELAESYLARLETVGARLGAVATLMRESALREARQAENEIAAGRWRGPLHGVPYGAKDLLATAGVPTTWGAAPYRAQVFDHDATVVKRLRDAGAVLVAKLQMIEIAGGMGYDEANASWSGPTRTPWNPDFWAGGSSSGSGAAVAAALVPFAIGSETWGSLITPAAFSGVTTLRPTYGRVSRAGAMALSWTLDKLGPLCRTADDCGLVLAAIAGADPDDPSAAARPYDYDGVPASARGFRVGVVRDATKDIQPEVARNFDASVAVLREVATIVEDVELPQHRYGDLMTTIIDAEESSAFEELIESGKLQQLAAPGSRTGGYSSMFVFARDYLRAMRLRGPIQRELDAVFAQYDAIAAPTRGTVAWPIGIPFRDAYPSARGGTAIGGAGNLAGLPALAVPNGFGESGLPTSLSLTGRAFEENRLIAIGAAYQARTDWHARRPPV